MAGPSAACRFLPIIHPMALRPGTAIRPRPMLDIENRSMPIPQAIGSIWEAAARKGEDLCQNNQQKIVLRIISTHLL